MFGFDEHTQELAEDLLSLYGLEDLLELNDLTDEEALVILLRGGYIDEPRVLVRRAERSSTEAED